MKQSFSLFKSPPPPSQQPVPGKILYSCISFMILFLGFHPIPMVQRVYMDPMNCSSNVYIPNGQPMISPQQQSSPTFPIFYSSSPPTPWIPTAPPMAQPPTAAPPYFMLSNHQQVQSFPFQQLI
jgi:hypothetical protein